MVYSAGEPGDASFEDESEDRVTETSAETIGLNDTSKNMATTLRQRPRAGVRMRGRLAPEMGWLQPQQTISEDDLGVLKAVGGGAFIAGFWVELSSLNRMISRPANTKPATMKASNNTMAIVVAVLDSVDLVGSLATSNETECCEPGISEFSKLNSILPSPEESGALLLRNKQGNYQSLYCPYL